MGKTVEVAQKFDGDESKAVVPNEYARGLIIEHAPSAQALKLMSLMIGEAGGRMAEDAWHKITLGQIRNIKGMRKHDKESLRPLFSELRAMTYSFDNTEKQKIEVGGFLDHAEIKYKNDVSGALEIQWRFSTMFKRMASNSNHWAILDRQTQFALRSRYSLLLFQHLASYFQLQHITYKRFSISELRAVLNIENSAHTQFKFLNRDVLKPTLSEINQLSRFQISMSTIKSGRSVTEVQFSWKEKPDLSPTKRELDSPKAGRKARREGKVEQAVLEVPFPDSGGLSYSDHWRDEGRRIWSDQGRSLRDFPDTAMIANHVRKKASAQNIPLNNPKIKTLFENVVKAWRG